MSKSTSRIKKKTKAKAPPKRIKGPAVGRSAMSNRNDRATKKNKRKMTAKRKRPTNRGIVRVLRRMILLDGIDITQLPTDLQGAGYDAETFPVDQ